MSAQIVAAAMAGKFSGYFRNVSRGRSRGSFLVHLFIVYRRLKKADIRASLSDHALARATSLKLLRSGGEFDGFFHKQVIAALVFGGHAGDAEVDVALFGGEGGFHGG